MSDISMDLILPGMLTDEDMDSLWAQDVKLYGMKFAIAVDNRLVDCMSRETWAIVDGLLTGKKLWWWVDFRGVKVSFGVSYL